LHVLFIYLASLLFFLLLSSFFSGSETALMVLDRLKLKYQAEAGDFKARTLKKILSNPDRLLSVILLGNNIANIAAASLVTYYITTYAPTDQAELISLFASTALTLVVLIFCELTPKIIAATHAESVSRRIFYPILATLKLLSPFARMAAWIANRLVALLGMDPKASPFVRALSEDEIRALIEGASPDGIDKRRKAMLHNVLDIGATQVREIMIPRSEVTAVEVGAPLNEILALIAQTNYSRIPVYREHFENILGILNVKDLLQHLQRTGEIHIENMLRNAHFVPDTARLEVVLRQMQSMHLHMSIVVDEFGGVEGIVTLEDLLEEIVGEIRDEHDTEVESIRFVAPNLYLVEGNLPVKDFNRFFKVGIPESREYKTVMGFLQARTGRLLLEGENVRYQDLTFTIEKLEGFRALSIRVRTTSGRVEDKVRPVAHTP